MANTFELQFRWIDDPKPRLEMTEILNVNPMDSLQLIMLKNMLLGIAGEISKELSLREESTEPKKD